jgi:hypothetical protein
MSRIYQNKPAPTSSPISVVQQSASADKINSKSPSPAPVQHHTEHDSKQFERMEKLVNRLESITSRLENASISNVPTTTTPSSKPSPVSVDINTPSLNAFNDLLNITLKSFLDQSSQIGGDVKSIVSQLYTFNDI